MKDTLRKASGLPHLGQVSLTLGCSLLDSLITSIGEGACGSIVVTSAASDCTVWPHLEQTKPFLVARIYEPHFSQNFMLSLQCAIVFPQRDGGEFLAGLEDPSLQSSRLADGMMHDSPGVEWESLDLRVLALFEHFHCFLALLFHLLG